MSTSHHDTRAVVELHRVVKTYQSSGGAVLALDDISLSAQAGSFVSIVGPSGCGKSTLLKVVAGLTPRSSGRVSVDGIEVDGVAPGLGMVFQAPVLLEWRTVLGNVLLPLEILHADMSAGRDRAATLLRTAGLDGFEHRYPRELSGGMQQRVAICRALIFDPSLLLMDEPFAALDALTREEMAMELLRIWEATRKTILFVTHSIDEAILLSDHVAVMSTRPGRILRLITIDLPRPRRPEMRDDPVFLRHRAEIHELIYLTRNGGAEPSMKDQP